MQVLDKKLDSKIETEIAPTVIGWQGVRCVLPPEWNLTGFSMDRESGYIRADAPGNSALTVQIRWTQANKPEQKTLYHTLLPLIRFALKRPAALEAKTDLRGSLEKMLKDTAKQAKKAKKEFESNIKPEKAEGPNDERTAINFTWTGEGRGQGKIWHCSHCKRILMAQVVGLQKDGGAIGSVAAQLFSTLRDHAEDGHDLWALYDLEMEVPEDFRLESQKLLSGYLHLKFLRGAEQIVIDRWGLANMTLKKFTLAEWFRSNALVRLKRLTATSYSDDAEGHEFEAWTGKLTLFGLIKALRDGRGGLRNFPTRYTGGAWTCKESNKIYSVQVLHSAKHKDLWAEVVNRCACH